LIKSVGQITSCQPFLQDPTFPVWIAPLHRWDLVVPEGVAEKSVVLVTRVFDPAPALFMGEPGKLIARNLQERATEDPSAG